MKVILASHMGMCFGVRDAIAEARAVADPRQTTIYGELVHNKQVVHELTSRGFSLTAENNREEIPPTPQVLITAHGVSNKERQRLASAGKALIDTTCPLVHRVHQAAQKLERDGYFVIVIGKHNHVEVRGIVGDLTNFIVVESLDEVARYEAPRLGIVCQTTTPPSVAEQIRDVIAARNPDKEIRFVDTICHPTRARQEAVLELLEKVDALVVVGGRNSNNTRQLVNLAQNHGVPALHIEKAADLDPQWFQYFNTVGLTAGTSTPDDVIHAVHNSLLAIRPSHESRREPISSRKSIVVAAYDLLSFGIWMVREIRWVILLKHAARRVFPFHKNPSTEEVRHEITSRSTRHAHCSAPRP